MRALVYLTRRSLINNLKKAVRKPATLIVLILGIVYVVYIAYVLGVLAVSVRMDSVTGLVILVTLLSLYLIPGNFLGYSSRKGILFKPAHAHFVFPSPVSPKAVLLNAAWMNYLMSFIIWILLGTAGFTVFHLPFWKALVFFSAGFVLDLLFEVSVMVFLYTNDRLPKKLMKGIGWFIRAVLICLTVFVIFYFRKYGFSVESALNFADWPVLQAVPVIGWQIALYRLILLGPTQLNVICSILYLAVTALAFAGVLRMKCDGGYYEEAAAFADDYAELKKKQKNGELVMSVGKKGKKIRTIRSKMTATGAKAIFFRQLLEYRKEKYFIFDKMTLFSLIFAVFFSYVIGKEAAGTEYAGMFLLGIVAYVSLVMSNYTGKWEQELRSPYLYLIPDTAIRKMWYATAMGHIKALADGCLICVPVGIAWKLNPPDIIYCILIFMAINADKMYTKVVTLSLVGNVFGRTGQSLICMALQMTFLAAGAGAAVLAGIFINMDFVFPIILIYSIMITVATAFLASLRFETMEQTV